MLPIKNKRNPIIKLITDNPAFKIAITKLLPYSLKAEIITKMHIMNQIGTFIFYVPFE